MMPTPLNASRFPAATILLAMLCCAPAAAQAPFLISAQDARGVVTIAAGSTLTLSAPAVGQPVSVLITFTYTGTTSAQIASVGIIGATQFSVISGPPATLVPGQSISFTVRYQPDSSAQFSAQVSVTYDESQAPPALPRRSVVPLNFSGVAPEFLIYYVLAADQNAVRLTDGGTLTFPPAPINTTTTTATIVIANIGSGPGTVTSASATPSVFQALGLPLLPGTLTAGAELRFTLRFAPLTIGQQTGTLRIVAGTTSVTASLQGLAIGSTFRYEILRNGQAEVVLPDQTLELPDTPVGDTASLAVRVTNAGNSDGQIVTIEASGGFVIPDRPFVPLTLTPNASVTFTVSFTTQVAQRVTGQLRIGVDRFPLAVTGLGSQLFFSYDASGEPVNVLPGGTVVFTPARIGQSSATNFVIENRGTRARVITSIAVSVATGRAAFSITTPALPLRLEPGAQGSFPVQFTPLEVGTLTATLQIDTATFTLSGAASLPPPPSGFRFEGASGILEPLTQPAIGLTLNEPYAVNLAGTLTMTFFSETFSTDPALQFATGGRTATFTIPAGQTRAIFANNSTELRFQTGTVEGDLTMTALFATSTGTAVSPGVAPILRATVPRRAPRLFSLQVSAITATSVTLVVSGHATTRSLRDAQFNFEATTGSGVTVPTTSFTIDLATLADSWFRSTGSASFGGQFSVSVPFTIQPSVPGATLPPLNTLFRAVSVTTSNVVGSSNTVSYTF